MARFTRIEVAEATKATGMVPVFYHSDLEVCKAVLKACYDGGVRVFEFTNRGDFAHEVFAELNKYAAVECPEMILGIGSVIDAATTALYLQLGTNFVVSPMLDETMAKVCNKRKVAWMPGCGSVTEVVTAHEYGAEIVKIFPGAQVGGPAFVKGVKGPFPYASIMPTGGVSPDEENLTHWIKAGVHCVGIGSQLFPKEVIQEKNYAQITAVCKNTLEIIQKLRA